MCCGSTARSWRSDQFGGRILGVPLHTRFIDASVGVSFAAIVARDSDAPSEPVYVSLGCLKGPSVRDVTALVATASVTVDFRPVRWLGLRLGGDIGVATADIDWPIFHFAIGPVAWF